MLRITALVGLVLLIEATQSREPSFAPEIASLEKVAADLAKAGRNAELDETLQILTELGMDSKAHDRLSATCRQDAAKVKKPAASAGAVGPSLEKVAKQLAARLGAMSDPERSNVARIVLRMDDRVGEAHAALGQEPTDGLWLDAAAKARRERENGIATALAKARLLDSSMTIEPSHHPEFAGIRCTQPLVAKWGRVEVHGVWPEAKLRRIVLAIARCSALINFLVTDRLEVPSFPARTFVLFDDAQEFQAAVRRGAKDGRVDPLVANMIESLDAAFFGTDEFVSYQPFEGHCESVLVGELILRVEWKTPRSSVTLKGRESWLAAGLINWSTLALLGERLPLYVVAENKESRSGSGRTSALSDEERIVRERMLRLSDAGISGGRTWLEYLARRGEDPPLSDSFRDQMGRIQGDDLLKSTFVVEMLTREGPLLPLFAQLPSSSTPEVATHDFEIVRKRPLADFERDWRAAFLPPVSGLVQRLTAPGVEARVPDAERQALDLLNAMRAKAGATDGPVEFDVAAADSCRRHARYLAQHPEQRDKWPDAHEEYPDRAGFDPRGAWAGAHSVVASGSKSSRDALAGWMATCYHRLPLLDPKLVRIGSACEEGCAVLDCLSFVKPAETWNAGSVTITTKDPLQWAVVWPAPRATDVPTHFAPEVPAPVPGVDPASLGFPVTFQLRHIHFFETHDNVLVLHLGGANGPAVDCYTSTPSAPSNPNAPTRYAWCLMPKAPLQSGATYTVTGKIHPSRFENAFDVEWSFRCGK